jgi:hypothetical protein
LRACFFRGDVNLENSERVDDAEGCCESDGLAFAHMSECGDMFVFDAKSSTVGAKDIGHVLSRTLWACAGQTLGRGTGTGTRCCFVLQPPSM